MLTAPLYIEKSGANCTEDLNDTSLKHTDVIAGSIDANK